MEIIDFLFGFPFGIGVVVNLCQRFVAVRAGVDIGISAAGVNFLKQAAAALDEFGNLFKAV